MSSELMRAAYDLSKAMNRLADENLPETLAGHVKTHSAIAVGSAFIPVPGADMAAAAANIWTMYIRINKELDLPFGENVVKSVAAGVGTNLASYFAARAIVGGALKLFPGLGTVGGGAILGATIYGVTIAAGVVYMRALAILAGKVVDQDLSAEELKTTIDEILSDKKAVKNLIDEAKKGYNADEVAKQRDNA